MFFNNAKIFSNETMHRTGAVSAYCEYISFSSQISLVITTVPTQWYFRVHRTLPALRTNWHPVFFLRSSGLQCWRNAIIASVASSCRVLPLSVGVGGRDDSIPQMPTWLTFTPGRGLSQGRKPPVALRTMKQ